MQQWQADLVLAVPDEITDDTLDAWQRRLTVAIDAELITRSQAARAWGRAVSDVA